MDRITLTGIRAIGRHGVFEHERLDGQWFVADVTLFCDTAPAARTDDLALTIDYGHVAELVAHEIGGEPCQLIETLAQRIADAVLLDERVQAVEVTIHKPQAPIVVEFADVAVTIVRSRT